MDIIKSQIYNALERKGIDKTKLNLLKITTVVWKLIWNGKFITYIEVDRNLTSRNSQSKKWESYRKNLLEYAKNVCRNESPLYSVVSLIDINGPYEIGRAHV